MKLSSITKALREATGCPVVELRRGKGYFYFSGGVADDLYEQGVYVNRLHSLTKPEWVRELTDRLPKR